MVLSFTDDFQVTWRDPDSARVFWQYDPVHFPYPLTPLTQSILNAMAKRVFQPTSEVVFVNGFTFIKDGVPPFPSAEVMEQGVVRIWQDTYAPRIKAAAERIRGADYEAMSLPQLAQSSQQAITDMIEAFYYTMSVIFAFMGPTLALVEFCEKSLGEDGPSLAAAVLQGSRNETAAAGSGLSDLAKFASAHPELTEALKAGNFDSISSLPGGAEFQAQFSRFLDQYGWRAETWSQPEIPTWREDLPAPYRSSRAT